MEFYESTYFIILVPSVVITVIFLFFWLFMKETSYDEILAKQKKDQKLPPAKVDKRKTDKKKNKKKESQNGNLHESDSETANREFDLMDALNEDEHVVPTPVIEAEPTVNIRERKKKDKKQPKPATEEPAGKEINGTKTPGKKAETVPVTKQPTPPPDVAGSKKKQGQKKTKNGKEESPVNPEIKTEQVVPTIKKQEKENVVPLVEAKTQESVSVKKKAAAKKQKAESPPALVDEPLIQPTVFIPLMDNSADPIVVEKKVEKREAVHAEKPEGIAAPQKGGNKKVKTVTDKENAEMKFKDFLVTMKSMILSEEEAMNVVDMLKEKSRSVQEIIHKANKGDSVALHQLQEKEKLLVAARDEAVGTKEQCKHLAQELHAEKQKSSLIEAKARERISAMEKEHSVFQNKLHSSFQDAQQMQLKFQQVRDQLESQLTHLKQENGILRDAVSSATNQMESKQSSELNKLRQEYARLMNELTEKNNKMAQEEMQKKSSDQLASKLKAQLQETERRVEEAETFLRGRLAESDAIKQEIQSKLSIKENETKSLQNEIKSLHSKLTDTIVSNQQLEQRVLQLREAGQNESLQMHVQELRNQNENLNIQIQKYHTQVQAQSSASVLVEELQKTITEKDKEIKQMENSLALERANFANSGEELKSIQRENISLKAELQKFQALMNEQVSAVQALEQMQKSIGGKDEKIRTLEEQLQGELAKVSSNIEHYTANKEVLGKMEVCMQEKDDKIKTVEELLETGLIEMANKEEELRTLRTENATLRKDVQNLKAQQANQISLSSVVEDLKNEIHEKEGKIKSVENLLQAEHLRADSQEKTVQALNEEVGVLKEALKSSQLEKADQVSSMAQIQELQNELKCKEEALKVSEGKSNERGSEITSKQRQLEDLQRECNVLKVHIEEVEKKLQQQDFVSSQDLQTVVQQKEEQIRILTSTLSDKEKHITDTSQEIQVLIAERESLKSHAYELQQKHEQQTQQVLSAVPSEELLKALSDKDRSITDLQGEVESLKSSLDQQRKKNNDLREKNWKAMEALASTEKMLQEKVNKTAKDKQQQVHEAEVEARAILKNLFPNVSVSASLCHGEWVQEFEKLAKVFLNESVGAEKVKAMEQKLKEAEDIHSLLQIECEKYKSVLAETEGILQRLQRSVEEEECRWKIKVEESQKELKEVHSTVHSLEQELALLRSQEKQSQNLLKERQHLETELEKAEVERATYVSEVRELKELLTELQRKLDGSYSEAIRQNEELTLLKSQLSETLQKLEGEQNERQKVAKDLHEAQKSLDLIQLEILKSAGEPNVIENTDISSETDGQERIEKVLPNLSQSVTQLQQCLQAVNQQLTKGGEHYQVIG
ncbi:kinectin isoform X1 [Pelobates cultripes]|uniref:Kinectin isoform X1 n=1 Tax=Pelobates cultripes TaxID=61616 RepID=A0AAD1WW40_PELCU|nr:kinectin isoform X1 [Pelobates cultripes]